LLSGALVALLLGSWPVSEPVVARTIAAMLILSIPNGLRTLCFRRSDETWADRVLLVLIRPLSAIWSAAVLARVVRTWGTLTLMKQGWTTRQKGAELVLGPEAATTGAPLAVGSLAVGSVATGDAAA
jgi:hypothetical protein